MDSLYHPCLQNYSAQFRLPAIVLALLSVVAFEATSKAQLTTAEEKGLPSNSVFSGGDVDVVNLQNGNLHISIPIVSSAQRGGGTLKYAFVFDTQAWIKQWVPYQCSETCNPKGYYVTGFNTNLTSNWRLTSPFNWGVYYTSSGTLNCPTTNYTYSTYTNWVITDPEGTKHSLPLRQEIGAYPCVGQTLAGPALDGSGLYYDSQAQILYTKDGYQLSGNLVQGQGQLSAGQDRNGNNIAPTSDTLGRNLVTTYNGTTGSGMPYTTYTINDSAGNPLVFRVDYESVTVTSDICAQTGGGCTDSSLAYDFPSMLTLPTGKTYVFKYANNTPGDLVELDLPTGAVITYQYGDFYQEKLNTSVARGTEPNYVGGRAVTKRTVAVNGQASSWTYTPSLGSDTVTDPLGNYQVHSFEPVTAQSGANPVSSNVYEMSVAYYNAQNRLLQTRNNTYAVDYDSVNNTTANVRLIQTTTTLDNGQTSEEQTDYETFSFPCFDSAGACSDTATRLNPTEKREYDYGPSGSGALLRRTDYAYLHTNNQSYVNLNIVDKPTTITVYDGNGNMAAQTVNEYDNYSHPNQPMQPSNAIQHNSDYGTGFTTRSNLTAMSKWRNTDGALITITNQFDDAGNVLSMIDPLGHPTYYSYADSWTSAACVPSGASAAFPTKVTNAKGQFTTKSYNACTGTVGSTSDLNANTTTYTYDSLDRPSQILSPDGGSKTFCYSDDPNGSCYNASTLTSTETDAINSSANLIKTTVYDGLGRKVETQLNSDADGTDYVDAAYDADGRVLQTSNPYRSGDTKYWTVNGYDGLGRLTSVTRQDNATTTTAYSGNTTTITDEVGNKRMSQTNALGQLTTVWEDPLGLNYETDYQYDGLGDLTQVVQKGGDSNAANWRVRSFTFDSLGELICASNPESSYAPCPSVATSNYTPGTVGYTYDADGNVSYRTDARWDTTYYGYDALNRLTSKTYSDSTPPTYFNYDENGDWGAPCSGGTPAGFVQCNGIGRMTSSGKGDSATKSIYGYDSMGRLTMKSTCFTTQCSSPTPSNWIDQYFTYDLAGDATSYDHGTIVGTGSSSYLGGHGLTYDSAGRLQSATAYQSIATPTSLFTATSYGPEGLLNSSLGNGLKETRSYDTRLRQLTYTANSPNPSVGSAPPWGNIDVVYNDANQTSAVTQSDSLYVQGWAASPSEGCPVASVEVDLDSMPIGNAALGGSRPDVQNGPFNGNPQFAYCGYNFTGSVGNIPVGQHTVNVYGIDTAGQRGTLFSQKQITVTLDAPPSGQITSVANVNNDGTYNFVSGGLVTINGWAIDSQAQAPVGAVRVLVDSQLIGYATLSVTTNDNSSYPNSGFSFTGGIGDLSSGTHTLAIIVYDSGGQHVTLNSYTINVSADTNTASGNIDLAWFGSASTTMAPVGGTLYASGWAGQPALPSCAPGIRVEVWLGQTLVGVTQTGSVSRPDVASYFNNPNCVNSGWSFSGPVTGVSPGVYTLTVRFYDQSGGSIANQSQTPFTVSGQMPQSPVTTTLPTQYAWSLGYESNGNVGYAFDSVNGDWAYLYDSLNRLSASGSTGNNGLAWQYDAYGNMLSQTVTGGTGTSKQFTYTTTGTSNRPDGIYFDGAGNQLNSVGNGGAALEAFRYDAESRLITSDDGNYGYVYDAEGQRIVKLTNGQPTSYYLYDAAGQLVTALDGGFNPVRREVYAGGRHLATYQGSGALYTNPSNQTLAPITYALADWLGTERARADVNGPLCQTTTSQPFGDNAQSNGTCFPSSAFFTGKERDPETGNDYFGARYYASSMGRFMTPDWDGKPTSVPYASFVDPQTLNLYTYVENGPVNRVDADGHASQMMGLDEIIELGGTTTGLGVCGFSACPPVGAQAMGYSANLAEASNLAQVQQSSASTGNTAAQPAQAQAAQAQQQNTELAQNNTPPPPGRINSPAQGQAPNSTVVIPDGKGGSTTRTYGPDGRATTDVDTGHDHGNVGDPHTHVWDWDKTPPRQPAPPLTPEQKDTAKRVAVGAAATIGTGYIIYRVIRFLPSLAPPLWPTIPANAIIP